MRAALVISCVALAGSSLGVAPAAAGGQSGDDPPRVRIVDRAQRSVLDQDAVTIRTSSGDPISVEAFVRDPSGTTRRLSRPQRVGRGSRRASLVLTGRGIRALARCGRQRLVVGARGPGGRTDFDRRGLDADDSRCYRVGLASRSINPDRDGSFDGGTVHLGGYGIGANPIFGERSATGILGDGVSVRAIALSGEGGDLAVADIETQGWFVATKDGPLGLVDMRKEVERRTNGRLDAQEVVIQSDHSHSGPDTIGVWGDVPTAYRRYIFDRTVDALVDAFKTRRRGELFYGVADGRDLLSNQFGYDPENEVVDSDVRVLQARAPSGRTFATLLNFSAHATVLGSSNTKASGDWVQMANPQLERRFGGEAMTMVGTLGRTQPADRDCPNEAIPLEDADAQNLCKIRTYGRRVVDRAEQAVARSKRLRGDPVVAARSYLVQDVATNALILGFNFIGDPIGADINRSFSPPWLTGDVLGTVTASARVGDVLLSSIPGEAYPQIAEAVSDAVPARGHMTAGLANDQLGYLIAPYRAYPEPIRRSFFNERGDEVSPIDNDNYFFNVSQTMGERVTCSLLRGAREVFDRGGDFRASHGGCELFANDLARPAGADTR